LRIYWLNKKSANDKKQEGSGSRKEVFADPRNWKWIFFGDKPNLNTKEKCYVHKNG